MDSEEYKQKKREIQKRYREKNREKIKEAGRIYREKNRELIKERCKSKKSQYDKTYREKNKENVLTKKREYYNQNKENLIKKNTARDKERRKIDPKYRMMKNLRNRLRHRLNKKNNGFKTDNLISCSRNYYIDWIEFQFDSNMNWNNYGKYWHIDHVKPLSLFELNNDIDIKKSMIWKNLRPFNSIKNMSKSNNYSLKSQLIHDIIVFSYLKLRSNNSKDRSINDIMSFMKKWTIRSEAALLNDFNRVACSTTKK